jgi:hypothetical protein
MKPMVLKTISPMGFRGSNPLLSAKLGFTSSKKINDVMVAAQLAAGKDRHKFERGIAQSGSAFALGAKCRWFKSICPDQSLRGGVERKLCSVSRRVEVQTRVDTFMNTHGRSALTQPALLRHEEEGQSVSSPARAISFRCVCIGSQAHPLRFRMGCLFGG